MYPTDVKIKYLNLKKQFDTRVFRKVFECKDFSNPNKVMAIMPNYESYLTLKAKIKPPENPSSDQIPLYREPLLTKQQEYHLFRQYNYLKFKCNKIFKKYDIETIRSKPLISLEKYLNKIASLKELLCSANARLAFRLARLKQYSDFESAVSDAYFALVYSLDHFNYTLNLKFATYVWYVIVDIIRKAAFAERTFRELLIGNDDVIDINAARMDAEPEENTIDSMLASITPRERDIIKYYYGLDGREMPLHEIGHIMKISKERVRQIRIAGMERIKRHYEKNRRLLSIEDTSVR